MGDPGADSLLVATGAILIASRSIGGMPVSRSRQACLVVCVVLAAWAVPAFAQHARTGEAAGAAAVLLAAAALVTMMVPLDAPARFVTRQSPARRSARSSRADRA
jgi:hypothetical protein